MKDIDVTLDKLIRNGSQLNDEESDIDTLTAQQDTLLNHLFALNDSLNQETKEEELKAHPDLYHSLRHKMGQFGALNRNNLRASQEKWVKKARVHRNKRKQAS